MSQDNDFKHGGNIYQFSIDNKIPIEKVIDFSSNINFIKPNIKINLDNINLISYPDPDYKALKVAISEYYDYPNYLDFELFNGASSAIFSLMNRIQPNHLYLYAPIYLEYKRIAKTFKIPYTLINRFETIETQIKENSFIIFVNPATPDGQIYNLKKQINLWISFGCTILIDESFLDFTDEPSIYPSLLNYPKLYILKSMTKFFSHAGIRIGYLISNPVNIHYLKQFEPPWKISSFDSYYIQMILKENDFTKQSKDANNKAKYELIKVLCKFKFIKKVYPGSANYILTELEYIHAHDLQKKLAEYHILIRICDNFDFLNQNHVRFAVKSLENISYLENALIKIERSL